jgi:NAD dependent epimerase/dehydratase family enzyme
MRLAFGEAATTVLDGQFVFPERLTALGYRFRFPELEAALRDLLA